jgi:hypothetical protein
MADGQGVRTFFSEQIVLALATGRESAADFRRSPRR